jgi:hypothetical protein
MTDLESFTPRIPLVDGSKTWAAFVRGQDNVERITRDELGIRVVFNGGAAWRVDAEGIGKEAMAPSTATPRAPKQR